MEQQRLEAVGICVGFYSFDVYFSGFVVRPQCTVFAADGALAAIEGRFWG